MPEDVLCPYCEKEASWIDGKGVYHCQRCGMEWWFTDEGIQTVTDDDLPIEEA